MTRQMDYHKPVLLHESVDLMAIKPDGIYVDLTFGGGGHSQEILNRLDKGKLYGFDQDPDARKNTPKDKRFTLIEANFRHLKRMLRMHGVNKVDGILGDFGISSHQIDEGTRGFSLRFDAPLDMRMNPEKEFTAKHVVNTYTEEKLADLFKRYGEIRAALPLGRAIVQARPLETTLDLVKVSQKFSPPSKHGQFLAQVFQAIRIEVNEELSVIEEMLKQCLELLNPEGRIICLSYHSLEDRLVKNFFRTGNFEGVPKKDFYGNLLRPLNPINRKPIAPGADEINSNSRARSAKLRAAELNTSNV
jgi:16S rRNA (cytosine1402-N4)-methyltransferase